LGLNSGLVREGYEANLVLLNLKEEYVVKPEEFVSKGKNNPFRGAVLKGRVKMTLKRGRIMFTDNYIIE
jgi:dihydroorotase